MLSERENVFTSHLSTVRLFISSRVNNPADAEDLVQETLERALRSAHHRPLNSPVAYIMQVAKSVVVDHWRKSSSVTEVAEENVVFAPSDPNSEPERLNINQDKLNALSKAIEQLPEMRRKAFHMRRVEGKTREQIASQLNISIDAVKKHINRALVDITTFMQQNDW